MQILVFSFIGDRRGRIIQVLYDGKSVDLQYSKLWSFEDPQTAQLGLFLRYMVCKPVGTDPIHGRLAAKIKRLMSHIGLGHGY